MIWQFVQVEDSSPRYEYAFDILNMNIPSPAKIPRATRTGNFHWSGGMNFLKRFLPDLENAGILTIYSYCNVTYG
jgi:hypothetical protein